MSVSPAAGEEFDKRLHRGAVLRVTLDKTTLNDPDIDERSKYIVIVSALLPDEDVWFVLCTSKPDHFDKNPQFANDILRWVPGEYPWCRTPVTVVDCTKVAKLPTSKLRELHKNGQLAFAGDIRPAHLVKIDAIMKASIFLSPEDKRWVVPW
jgi:hypothetical protein